MEAKVGKKIAISSSMIKNFCGSMNDGEVKKIISVAGIAGKVKVKHSEVGSGLVFLGDFVAKDEKTEIEAQALILPPELGERIAQEIAESKKKVRFSGSINMLKSDKFSIGYEVSIDFSMKPEKIEQVDIVRDMMKAE